MKGNFAIGFLCLVALLLVSCNDKPAAPVNFDPNSLGPNGAALDKYLKRNLLKPGGATAVMDVEIQASIPNLEKSGVMQVERTVAANGKVTYEVKGYTGDNTIKKDVIARYLSSEEQASEAPMIGITPANYKFRYRRTEVVGTRTALVFELTPRKGMVGLFRGELWIEEGTGLPIKESGRMAKNPSVIFKSVDFSREYEITDDKAVLSRMDSEAETRVVGKVKMTMNFTKHRVKPAEPAPQGLLN